LVLELIQRAEEPGRGEEMGVKSCRMPSLPYSSAGTGSNRSRIPWAIFTVRPSTGGDGCRGERRANFGSLLEPLIERTSSQTSTTRMSDVLSATQMAFQPDRGAAKVGVTLKLLSGTGCRFSGLRQGRLGTMDQESGTRLVGGDTSARVQTSGRARLLRRSTGSSRLR
jgi:hypothetical protein